MNLTEAEWKIMHGVWRRHPASTRDVLEVVAPETGWAYTTVKTMLSRLVDKGALDVRLRANTSLYSPRLSRSRARRAALRQLAGNAFDGALGPMMHFLVRQERLSDRDRDALRSMLDGLESEATEEDDSP